MREGDYLGETGIFRRIILKEVFKKWDEGWIDGSEYGEMGAFVNAVMNLRVP
jgi:hypothetical protein